MIAPDSTSYPTLAVIQHHGLQGDQRISQLIWERSETIFALLRRRMPSQFANAILHANGVALTEALGPGRATIVASHLVRNCEAAHRWCVRDARAAALRASAH